MKAIYICPFAPLWSDQIREISRQLNVETLYLGDLLRSEIRNGTELGVILNSEMSNSGLISSELVVKVVIQRFMRVPGNIILIGFPVNNSQAVALADKKEEFKGVLNAIVVGNYRKEEIERKFISKYACKENATSQQDIVNGKDYRFSVSDGELQEPYNLESNKLKYIIDSYCDETTGQVASAKYISRELGSEYMEFNELQGSLHEIMLRLRKYA